MPILEIPLSQLTLSDLNVRKTRTKADIEAMAASVLAEGLLQNLLVHPAEESKFAVVIGGTRLAAMQLLARDGKVPADYLVVCDVRPANDASLTAKSLAENFRRSQMNPVEEFRAFDLLRQQGKSSEEIAASEGTTLRHVEQRLKLAAVSPKLIDIAHKGEMTMAQLMAFTISDKPREQEKVWRELPEWAKRQGDGENIRATLTEKQIDASQSALAKFVGVDAYEAAGGHRNRDLFADESNPGYITNPKLLMRLADDRLTAIAKPLRSEGWKWVEIRPDFDWQEQQKLQTIRATLSEEQVAEITGYEAEQAQLLEGTGDDDGNLNDKDSQTYNELEEKIAAVRAAAGFTLAQKSVAGVIVTIRQSGEAEIKRGLVKPDDFKAAKKLDPKVPKANGADHEPEKPRPEFSVALIEELTAHRTLAMQAKVASNPKVAMVALIDCLMSGGQGSAIQITTRPPHLNPIIGDGIAKTPAAKELAAATREATKGIPRDPAKRWDWLMQQSPTRLQAILAAEIAPAVDAVQRKFNGADRGAADQLATALKLDMSEYWHATAEGYFGRVSKTQAIAAVTEAAGEATARNMDGMKKAVLAVAAEKAVKGKGWIPAILANG